MGSINKAQASETDAMYYGVGIKKGEAPKLTGFEEIIFQAANSFIKLAKTSIKRKSKIDSGNMSDILIVSTQLINGKYTLSIGYDESNPAEKYYDYQNKGVKGFKSGKPNSPYEFKDLYVGKDMLKSIMDWYLRHQNYIKNEDQKKGLKSLQRKRKAVSEIVDRQKSLKSLAFLTARSIKRKGLKRVGFIDDNLEKVFNEEFKNKLAKAIGQDIVINIKQTFNGNSGNTK